MEDELLIVWVMNDEFLFLMNGYLFWLVFGGWLVFMFGKWFKKIVVRDCVYDGVKMLGKVYWFFCKFVVLGVKVVDEDMCIIEVMFIKLFIIFL